MSLPVISAIAAMFAALGFYTVGVWSEKLAGVLKPWHLLLFWLGFSLDTLGTGKMYEIAGGMQYNLHGLTGVAAIVLMLIHALWASWVLYKKDRVAAANFHRFSIFVWVAWLIPFVSGLIIGRH